MKRQFFIQFDIYSNIRYSVHKKYVIGGVLLWGVGKVIFLLENIYDAIASGNNGFKEK